MDLVRKLMGYEEFNYWGWSYGTVIGAMYAAMFPESVGRIVLDGTLLAINFANLKALLTFRAGPALPIMP
jgi:pimeloyl-ACP methyl ester carboxylesterase